jgi:hypothetical protein
MATQRGRSVTQESTDRLKGEVQNLLGAVRDRAVDSLRQRAGDTVDRLNDYTQGGGGPGLMAAATGAKNLAEGKSPGRAMMSAGWTGLKGQVSSIFGGGKGKGGGQGKKLKVTNIVETIDVGVPVRVAYNQWTQFSDFPSFMKKVENVEQESDEELHWRAQILWSHRNWKSTILRQTPDQEIVWRSDGDKGYVDGAVTFHELAPSLTRMVLVLEYHPKGFFEHTGNVWRAQGRRARLELKHFRRHVMTQTLLHPEEIEGWRGVIEDGEVIKDHETALREEEEQGDRGERSREEPPEDEEREPEDEFGEDEEPEYERGDYGPEDELPESSEPEEGYEDERGYDDEGEPRDSEGNGQRPPRRRRGAGEERPARRRAAPARARRANARRREQQQHKREGVSA